MQKKNRLQTVLTSWISLSMVLGLSGFNLMAESVKAAPTDLLISEVNFLGSSMGSTDDWIEIYNPGNLDIVFGTPNTYAVYENAGLATEKQIAALNSGTIKKNSYLLISKLAPSTSTLNVAADLSFEATVDGLSDTGAEYSIKKNGTTIIDTVNTTPFVGLTTSCADKNINESCVIASVAKTINGLEASKSIGYNFDLTVEQFGTPANQADLVSQTNEYENSPVIGDALVSGISPVSPTYLDIPTISGQKGAANASITLKITNQATLTANAEVVDVRNDLAFSHAFTAASVAGSYAISTFSSDALGNRSVERSLVKNYTINKLVTTVEATPLYTNKTNVVVKGMTTPGAMYLVENTTTGIIPTYALVNADGSFTATVDLQADTANSLIVRTKIGSLNAADPILITVNQDSVLPVDLIKEKTILNIGTPGNPDTTNGLAGAYTPYEANIKVEAYADALLTKLIGSAVVNADGSFDKINLGDNKYAAIYLVATDLAGNKSANAVVLENPINFVNSSLVINGQIGTISQNSAKITWEKVPGAVSYRLKYKTIGGVYSNPMDVCLEATCSLDSTIIGLSADSNYTFALAAVDKNGNESAYTEYSFRTLAVVPVITEEIAVVDTTTTPSRVITEDTTTQVLPTPTPTPATEEGDVKSTSETNESKNWTPWIILGILAGLAVLATSGYFYWFGGEAGEVAMGSVVKNSEPTAGKKEEEAPKNNNKKDKRW